MTSKGRVVYFNGEMIPETEAKISIYDSALMFGDMVFEMTRSFNKKQFKLREHLERLYAGLKILRIPLEMTIDEMEKACHQTVEANDHLFGADDEHRLLDLRRDDARVVEDLLVDELLALLDLGRGERLEVGEVKTESVGRLVRAELADVRAEHLAQRPVHEVRRGVVTADRATAREVDVQRSGRTGKIGDP